MLERALDWIGIVAVVLLGGSVALSILADDPGSAGFGATSTGFGATSTGFGATSTGFGATDWAILAISIPAGLLAADFVSGLAHWLADRVLPEDTPILGTYFVRPFREHHREPEGILLHDWVETIGNTCISVSPLLALSLLALEPMAPGSGRTAMGALALSLAGWLCLTNQIHKSAHTDSPSAWIEALQRSGLVLSAGHHARHHESPYDVRYCITTGWFNPVLDRIRFFALAERALRRVGLLSAGLETTRTRRGHPPRSSDGFST